MTFVPPEARKKKKQSSGFVPPEVKKKEETEPSELSSKETSTDGGMDNGVGGKNYCF